MSCHGEGKKKKEKVPNKKKIVNGVQLPPYENFGQTIWG
jgi:hypothetical protein